MVAKALRGLENYRSQALDKPAGSHHHVGISGCVGLGTSPTPTRHFSIVDLELQSACYEKVSVLRCRGRLVYGPATEELVRATRQLLETTQQVVLQMADVTHIDSGGVGALGAAYMAAHNREGEIKLAALSPRVAEVLRITGLEMLFDIRNSESEAVAAFSAKETAAVTGLEGAAETT